MNLFKSLIVALTLCGAGSLAACNTMHGAGEDVEATGEAIQKGVDKNRPE